MIRGQPWREIALGCALGALPVGAAALAAAPTAPYAAPVPPPVAAVPRGDAPEDIFLPSSVRAEVRDALIDARAAVVKAPGMREAERRVALSKIDDALSKLDSNAAPTFR